MTRREPVFTAMVVATTSRTPKPANARRTRARAPSVAYPRPQALRRSR